MFELGLMVGQLQTSIYLYGVLYLADGLEFAGFLGRWIGFG